MRLTLFCVIKLNIYILRKLLFLIPSNIPQQPHNLKYMGKCNSVCILIRSQGIKFIRASNIKSTMVYFHLFLSLLIFNKISSVVQSSLCVPTTLKSNQLSNIKVFHMHFRLFFFFSLFNLRSVAAAFEIYSTQTTTLISLYVPKSHHFDGVILNSLCILTSPVPFNLPATVFDSLEAIIHFLAFTSSRSYE